MSKLSSSRKNSRNIIPLAVVERKIFIIHGCKVMIDADIAELYGVTTKVLNQAVKRNKKRFPQDFMFKLSDSEKEQVVTNCDHLSILKFSHQLPYAFTEHGAVMLSAVLKSKRAIEMSVFIVRAFIKLRQMLSTHKDLANKFNEMVRIQVKQGRQIETIQSVLLRLTAEPEKFKKRIGFDRNDM